MEQEAASLSSDYANYLRANVTQDAKNVEDAIEDTLTRLDEFTGLMEMLECETNINTARSVLDKKTELVAIFENVRKLENVVSQVKKHLDAMEEVVVKAETQLNFTVEGKIRNFLQPLFNRKRGVPSSKENSSQPPVFTPPQIFCSKDFFAPRTPS